MSQRRRQRTMGGSAGNRHYECIGAALARGAVIVEALAQATGRRNRVLPLGAKMKATRDMTNASEISGWRPRPRTGTACARLWRTKLSLKVERNRRQNSDTKRCESMGRLNMRHGSSQRSRGRWEAESLLRSRDSREAQLSMYLTPTRSCCETLLSLMVAPVWGLTR